MKTSVGLIGLGLMGRPMAANLLKAGYELSVWNRTASRADELVAEFCSDGEKARFKALPDDEKPSAFTPTLAPMLKIVRTSASAFRTV